MATTITYKGSDLTSFSNTSKTLRTAGKYLEGDITITAGLDVNNQNKTVIPSETTQSITADTGYSGLGTVTVNGITNTYVGSSVPTQPATTITPSSATQTVTGQKYMTGDITVEPIPPEYIIPAGTITLTTNTTAVDITQYAYADVNVTAPTPRLQHKTFQPSETSTTITCDSGYNGLASVQVYGITSTYVGSGVTRRSSSDMYDTEGKSSYIITAPSGYYAKDGLYNIAKMDGQTVTPTTSQQTIQTASKYLLGNITISAIPSQYIVPSGTLTITSVDTTTTFNATSYASVAVNLKDADSTAY